MSNQPHYSRMGQVKQEGSDLVLRVPLPGFTYLQNIMRSDSFDALWPLYRHAHDPMKEFTESYAAHKHLSRWRRKPWTVLHVGDGAHARTAAMFAYMTKHDNIAIDPATDEHLVGSWKLRFGVERFSWFKGRVEDFPLETIEGPVLVTFVHAHVDTDAVLARLGDKWIGAYTNVCCKPGQQLGKTPGIEEGEDWNILSPMRQYKVMAGQREEAAS